jgi:hypothetical protein
MVDALVVHSPVARKYSLFPTLTLDSVRQTLSLQSRCAMQASNVTR